VEGGGDFLQSVRSNLSSVRCAQWFEGESSCENAAALDRMLDPLNVPTNESY